MRVLLDTNAFLWANDSTERLGNRQGLIEDRRTDRLVSDASAWEIAIKWALRRLDLPDHPARYVPSRIHVLAASSVAIHQSHTLAVADLPLHHGDPFDRLLIAQARAIGVPILTADRAFRDYDVDVLLIE